MRLPPIHWLGGTGVQSCTRAEHEPTGSVTWLRQVPSCTQPPSHGVGGTALTKSELDYHLWSRQLTSNTNLRLAKYFPMGHPISSGIGEVPRPLCLEVWGKWPPVAGTHTCLLMWESPPPQLDTTPIYWCGEVPPNSTPHLFIDVGKCLPIGHHICLLMWESAPNWTSHISIDVGKCPPIGHHICLLMWASAPQLDTTFVYWCGQVPPNWTPHLSIHVRKCPPIGHHIYLLMWESAPPPNWTPHLSIYWCGEEPPIGHHTNILMLGSAPPPPQ